MTPVDDGDTRVIAFYLPQFHPIPENDRWWGAGFTEWTNVSAARPLFPGHYQPHLPADLGFYDLRLPEARQAQADLAGAYGVSAFCYWHYWFEGRRLLERPFDEVLSSGKPDFPFCLGWANHTWSRRWTGEERDVLVTQNYSAEDDVEHARWMTKAFADPRYVRVSQRPVFMIFAPLSLPEPRRTCETFRDVAIKAGLAEPFLIGGSAFAPADGSFDARKYGFDATLNHEPTFGAVPQATTERLNWRTVARNLAAGRLTADIKVYDYGMTRRHMRAGSSGNEAIPCVFVSWDNTPRRGRKGIVVVGATPDRFAEALKDAVESVKDRPPHERLVFVNAWNEWAEGMYLEPDRRYGRKFLEAVKRVMEGVKKSPALSDGQTAASDSLSQGNAAIVPDTASR